MSGPLLPHQERAVAERSELRARYDKLLVFINSSTFGELSFEDANLLVTQLEHMGDYIEVLSQRINRFHGVKNYRCSKKVEARPMTRQAYNDLRGWYLPSNENGADEGYLVEELDTSSPNHTDFLGYISWSPKAVFERHHTECL